MGTGTSNSPLGRDRNLGGRRILDLAEGILIGSRRYSTEAAFEELAAMARRHGVSVWAVAEALVALATGDGDVAESQQGAALATQLDWKDLFTRNIQP